MENRWSLSFIPKEAAFGILSVLLPLYVVEELNGNLLHIGLIIFVNSIIQVPAVLLWSRYISREAKCKNIILMALLVSSLAFFLFTISESVLSFFTLNIMLSIVHVAISPATQVLISESSPRSNWEASYAQHRFTLSAGGIIGLFAGALWLTQLNNRSLMLLCGLLVLLSSFLAYISIEDPFLLFEQKIARFERFVSFTEQAANLVFTPTDYKFDRSYLNRYPNLKNYSLGIFLFPLASNMVLTSIPIFLSHKIGAPSSIVFSILLVKSITSLIGYFLIKRREDWKGLQTIKLSSLLHILFVILILFSNFLPYSLSLTLSALGLALAGIALPYFSIFSTTLWMEVSTTAMTGIYNASRSLGMALGGFFGGFIPLYYGFNTLFLLGTAIYGLSLFFFIRSIRMNSI
jgi:predicted MFS family arabinose efflux permease